MTRLAPTAAVLIAVSVLAVPGCKGDGRLACHPVRGQLFIDGQPAYGGKVFFFPVTPPSDPRAKCPIGQVDESGAFVVTTYNEGDGVPVGEYVLCFEWPNKHALRGTFDGSDRLGGKFMKIEESKHRVTVAAGPNDIPKIDLKANAKKQAEGGIFGGDR